jgi:hypothetical protein
VDKFKDAADGMAFTKDELAKGMGHAGDGRGGEGQGGGCDRSAQDAKVDKFKDAAEGMAFTKDELAAGIKALGDEKAKADAAIAALKDAKVEKFATPAEGVKALARERVQAQSELAAANATLDAVVKPLVDNKHLPAGAKRADAPKGVMNLLATADHPAVKGLAEAVRRAGRPGRQGQR